MVRSYLAIDLLDDHIPGEATTIRQVIGVYVLQGAVPRIVACGPDLPPGRYSFGESISLNEVMVEGGLDHPHRGHLTHTSLLTISAKQRNMLYDDGFLNFERHGCYVELFGARPLEML